MMEHALKWRKTQKRNQGRGELTWSHFSHSYIIIIIATVITIQHRSVYSTSFDTTAVLNIRLFFDRKALHEHDCPYIADTVKRKEHAQTAKRQNNGTELIQVWEKRVEQQLYLETPVDPSPSLSFSSSCPAICAPVPKLHLEWKYYRMLYCQYNISPTFQNDP